ncbi:hypothetical protein MASR2M47_19320 [Draconibacterium sp.]
MALANEEAHEKGVGLALKTAGLMFDAGYKNAFIVLADENGSVEVRTKNAGRISPEMGLTENQWKTFAAGAEKVAKAVKDKYGMRTVFHHHCGGYVETPQEVAKLMELTNPEILGLCLDMGHYAFGGGNPVEALKNITTGFGMCILRISIRKLARLHKSIITIISSRWSKVFLRARKGKC